LNHLNTEGTVSKKGGGGSVPNKEEGWEKETNGKCTKGTKGGELQRPGIVHMAQ